MTRVGLLTIHDTQNWGSIAQTLGTYKDLEKIGVNTCNFPFFIV